MNLNLAWWNIGISPPILQKNKTKAIELGRAGKIIKEIAVDKSIDFWVFCEVSENDASYLKTVADTLDLEFMDFSCIESRIVIDMAIMYESSKLEFISSKNIITRMPDESRLRIGIKATFKEIHNDEYITFFLSHWPSRLSLDEQDRTKFASTLRTHIESIFDKYGDNSKIILMGDYNSQPYSFSLHETLFSTKDVLMVKKRKRLLFNPFWNLISDGNYNNIGTYYFDKPKIDRWFVFDQMMFSSSFLCSDNLKLDLNSFECHSVHDRNGDVTDKNFLLNFDHFPIFGRLHYE